MVHFTRPTRTSVGEAISCDGRGEQSSARETNKRYDNSRTGCGPGVGMKRCARMRDIYTLQIALVKKIFP
jgi:hypothetical protein